MASQRPSKRPRPTTDNSSYHDAVPFGDGYDAVHSREHLSRRVGNVVYTAPAERTAQSDTSWDSATAWTIIDDPQYCLDPDGGWYDEVVDADVMEEIVVGVVPPQKKKRSMVSKRPHVVWKELHRDSYLDEMVRWAGRADFRSALDCPDCIARRVPPGRAEYRCCECFVPDLVCAVCCLKRHRTHPLHWIEKWTGSCFERISLMKMGHKIQLNHASLFCSNPTPAHGSFLVIHINGIHEVAVLYCACTRTVPQHLQLLRRGFYPASQLIVKTCASFEVLELLHKLALTTKASTYDFYRALEKLTVNTGISVPKNRYRGLLRMALQWRHLKMMKWGGRGHHPSGAAGTGIGELAVLCPSCPRPEVNLPVGWETEPLEKQYLYRMFVCMDANFRLKNQLVSNYSQDPGLGIGFAYMLPRQPYERYVVSRANDADISTCVGLQAIAKAFTKFSQGLRHTGVGGAFCGRSEMILPVAIGNLQKGERYANMDYVFASAIQNANLPVILISYDIACQWFINLPARMDQHWLDDMRIPPSTQLIPAIPKLHEPMHGKANHQMYSLNFIPGVGYSDLETPERVWAAHNALGNSTKTQGPGSRQDVLDDHFGFWNWLKFIGLGKTLARKYKHAVADRNIQSEGHRGLTACMDPELAVSWEAICVTWDDAEFPKKVMNPYHIKGASITGARVRKELAEEEEARLADGGIARHATSASGFIELGLYLEEVQYRIRHQAKKPGATSTVLKAGGLTEQRNLLRTRLRGWERLVPIYMPGLLQFQSDGGASTVPVPTSSTSSQPEDQEVWLPSHVPALHRVSVCLLGLPEIEARLAEAQAHDSLEKIRDTLKVKSRMIDFKNKNIRGQRDGTRSRSVIDSIHDKARLAAERYRRARLAKMELSGPGDWEDVLRVLNNSDIRGYSDPNRPVRQARRGTLDDEQLQQLQDTSALHEDDNGDDELTLLNPVRRRRDGTGETRRTLSWIWISSSNTADSAVADDILRAEWAKSRARATRAAEEVLLLREEMRRVLCFMAWKADWWRSRGMLRTGVTKEMAEGLEAYATSQADLYTQLATEFLAIWKRPLDDANFLQEGGATEAADASESEESDEGGDGVADEDPEDDDNEMGSPL